MNRESIDAVRGRRSAAALQRPDHARFGFAQLPGLIRSRFGGARSPLAATAVDPLAEPVGPESVVLFLIDGLGWSLFERFAGHRFAAR
ncbi:MAG: hypothetical protein KC636_32580, partial [Myxococcales bacterium]|nr:hypothetical protein [Myxococcales bacterium]